MYAASKSRGNLGRRRLASVESGGGCCCSRVSTRRWTLGGHFPLQLLLLFVCAADLIQERFIPVILVKDRSRGLNLSGNKIMRYFNYYSEDGYETGSQVSQSRRRG